MEETPKFRKVAAKVIEVLEEYLDDNGKTRTPFFTEETIKVNKVDVTCYNIRSRAGTFEKHKKRIEGQYFMFNERV